MIGGGLLGLVVLTGFLCTGPSREGALVEVGPGSLTIQVRYVTQGGAQPADGERRAPQDLGPAGAVDVMAVPSGGGSVEPVGIGTTDEDGAVALELAPGSYWVFVPPPPREGHGKGEQEQARLPDGTPVLGWVEVELSEGSSEAVTISIELATA